MTSELTRTGGTRPRSRYAHRARIVLALVLGAVLAAGACGTGAQSGSANGPVQEMTYLNTLPIESLTYAPELIADTNGYFAAQGLRVNFQYINGTPAATAAIMSGQGVLTRAGDTDIINSISSKGARVVNVGTGQKGGTTIRIVSSKRKPIATPADLRGKVIGEAALGGTTEGILTLVLNSAGMRISDVQQQVVGMSSGVFNLVQAGRLDGYMVSMDTALQLQASQPDAVILDPSQYIAAGSQAYITSTEQSADPAKRDQIQRYLRAIKSAIQFIADDQRNGYANTIRLISDKYRVPVFSDPAVTRASLDAYLQTWTFGGIDKAVQVDDARWTQTYDEMVAAGMVAGGANPREWIDGRLAPTS
ncbi:ABC transporter substrate-binding protein [Saccharopolyspora sp. 5N708]|uniref:ABC transporter substrate-binding protein n=1 Tax=Saccharopolyspora sp. 5N708 TaxID=3457424 RepID=UPI003FD5C482